MNLLTCESFSELLNNRNDLGISFYIPTYRTAPEAGQSRIRLKNLLQDAEKRLISRGMRSSDAKQLLEPVEALVLDNQFWQQRRDGLAIFLAENFFRHYSLPLRVDESLQIGRRFYIKPLLPLLNGEGLFYILALSQNAVRILRCTQASVSELHLDGIPHSMAEAMQYDDPQRQLQFHSNTLEGTNTKAAAIFHGHGIDGEIGKDRIRQYFRLIDRGLHKVLRGEKAPLVLAGVEFLFPIYREANTYAYLAGEGLPGNPEELAAEDLQTLAWPLVEHYYHKAEQEALTYYGPLQGTGRTTHDVTRAVPAAYNGQVEILFLAKEAEQRGSFNPQTNEVHLSPETEPGDEDLYDLAAVHTILNGGQVYMVEADLVPAHESLAALLRY